MTPAQIRALRAENPKTRARDLAEAHGLPEAALVAAHLGHGATALQPHPDQLMPLVGELGDVMAGVGAVAQAAAVSARPESVTRGIRRIGRSGASTRAKFCEAAQLGKVGLGDLDRAALLADGHAQTSGRPEGGEGWMVSAQGQLQPAAASRLRGPHGGGLTGGHACRAGRTLSAVQRQIGDV